MSLAPPNPFVIEAMVEGVSGEVYVNDIPVGRVAPDPGNPRLGLSINHLIRNGRNYAELVLDPGDHPSAARQPTSTRAADGVWGRVKLSRYAMGAAVGEAAPLEVLGHATFDGDGQTAPFPFALTAEATVASPFPPWSWERAEPLRLGARLTAEVMAFLADYRAALAWRDIARENALSAIPREEVCVAFGRDPRATSADVNALLTDEWSRADWGVDPIEEADLDLRLVAEGRMVQCIRRDWSEAIRSTYDSTGGRMTVPTMLGRLDGRLQWIR